MLVIGPVILIFTIFRVPLSTTPRSQTLLPKSSVSITVIMLPLTSAPVRLVFGKMCHLTPRVVEEVHVVVAVVAVVVVLLLDMVVEVEAVVDVVVLEREEVEVVTELVGDDVVVVTVVCEAVVVALLLEVVVLLVDTGASIAKRLTGNASLPISSPAP